MDPGAEQIAQRLSLRPPQRDSLDILAEVSEIITLGKGTPSPDALEMVKARFPHVTDFEREFPSLCFALATGVGKTRLMGAFIAYLYQAKGIRNFFVLAPSLTIYNKLIQDFTPNTPKYVFQGLADFAVNPPEIVTGDDYESGRGVRAKTSQTTLSGGTRECVINIFNISKINTEVRGGNAPRIKRLSEYIGQSYFDYLASLPDLVLLMDESHRYRASAGVKAINELKPILGLEVTATPRTPSGTTYAEFKNVIYSYPLSKAMEDGFVKEPAVATRENFNVDNYTDDQLELLKLEDGVRIHEETKQALAEYASATGKPVVKPFVLVVCKDIDHANKILATIKSPAFFDGAYKDKVITVHSKQGAEEKDENVAQLVAVEQPGNLTEIVIHVDMLKEGWDVNNLYTIIPLRKADSVILVEQSIGRGLRLPYGKRTGNKAVDRLTVVAHDKFAEIISHANNPNSLIRSGVYIGRDVAVEKREIRQVKPVVLQIIEEGGKRQEGKQQTLTFPTEAHKTIAVAAIEELKNFEHVQPGQALTQPAIQAQIVERIQKRIDSGQILLPPGAVKPDVKAVTNNALELYESRSIKIPRITVHPTGEVHSGIKDFDLDVTSIDFAPVPADILVQELRTHDRSKLISGTGLVRENRLEDHIVGALMDLDDVSYDDHADLLYKLAADAVKKVQSYLPKGEDVRNVLLYHQKAIASIIHDQMMAHYYETAIDYEVKVSKGFTTHAIRDFSVPVGGSPRSFREPVEERKYISGLAFGGFTKCIYPIQKFDSDAERKFAVILENEKDIKWFKPDRNQLRIGTRPF